MSSANIPTSRKGPKEKKEKGRRILRRKGKKKGNSIVRKESQQHCRLERRREGGKSPEEKKRGKSVNDRSASQFNIKIVRRPSLMGERKERTERKKEGGKEVTFMVFFSNTSLPAAPGKRKEKLPMKKKKGDLSEAIAVPIFELSADEGRNGKRGGGGGPGGKGGEKGGGVKKIIHLFLFFSD